MKKLKLIIYALLTLGCMIAIFILSSQEKAVSGANSLSVLTFITEVIDETLHIQTKEEQIIEIHHIFRKFAHFSAYATLSVFSYNMFRLIIMRKKYVVAAAFALCVVRAILDEIHQIFVPGRSGEIRDVLIDTFGACVGLGLVWTVNLIHERLKSKGSK